MMDDDRPAPVPAAAMDPEELRLRSLYLFLACSHAIDQFKDRLAATFPNAPLSAHLSLERSVRRELGLLFRYWTTRRIWERLESRETDAKQLNLTLLRLFTEAFRLPKDGSGLRYAELSTSAEETQELRQRLVHALGTSHEPLMGELEAGLGTWRDAVLQYTNDALELPLEKVSQVVKAWAQRSEPRPTG